MPEIVRQLARCYLGLARAAGQWKYHWFRWSTWPRRAAGHLILGSHVGLFVPLRCDGEGVVHVADRTKLGSPPSARCGSGEILLQARTKEAVIRIAEHCAFSNNVSIIAVESVRIGEDCLIGDFVSIMDSDFHGIAPDQRRTGSAQTAPVNLENNVWLGSRVIVQKGVTIGENSIVAPSAVVTSSIPPNSIAAGVPAKVVRTLSEGPAQAENRLDTPGASHA